MVGMNTFDESLHPRGNAGQFATKTNDAPAGTLAPTVRARACAECESNAEYRYANIPRGYRTKNDPLYCGAHAAKVAAEGQPIEVIPTGPATVWLVEGDDHEYELVEACSEDEALDIAADQLKDRYGDEEDGEDYDPRDSLTIVGAFTGDPDDTDELVFIETEGADDEARALEALAYI
ncbi:hypothetical protein CXR34_08605 [Microbacterium hominis]|uniref:Uncharacterized protein n=2 Tax=Microbacterium hominis TaxID=162426 RepID=A0A2K9DMA5_9MICO|nr:hypothetical protein CXR34_08605 [Microbacterium hominis]